MTSVTPGGTPGQILRDHHGGLQEFILGRHDARTVPKYERTAWAYKELSPFRGIGSHHTLIPSRPSTWPSACSAGALGLTPGKSPVHSPFEVYYFDYAIGLLVLSLCIGLTLGRIDPLSPNSVVLNRPRREQVAIRAPDEVDIVPCPVSILTLGLTPEDENEQSNQINCSDICLVIVVSPYPFDGRLPDSARQQANPNAKQSQYGLRLRLPENKVLLVHDGSQDRRAMLLRDARWTTPEGSPARQRLGERESRGAR
ncbi:MAG: hypothetical protein QOJ42_1813 [Acidobacteriaceae bacterium]|nr:hypothetical protein [Acidobacteriaceae bacterium]